MKVLIIGAKGMLGQELVKTFSIDHHVTAWDREEIDITDEQVVSSKLRAVGPDIVINAAAFNDVDGAETNSESAKKINGYAVGYLATSARELNIPIVHYSTEYVFDGNKKDGYRESDQPNPQSVYAVSKYLGEQELQNHTNEYYLIRLSRLFGGSGIGKKSFVQTMLDLARSRSELEVVDEELSCPTYAVDLARRTKYIVEHKLPYGIYHCANSGAVTWYGFAQEIFKISGKNVKLNPVPASRFPRPAQRPAYGILLNTKLPAMRSWPEALREFLK